MNKTGQAMSQTLGTQAHRLEAQVYQALANPTRLDILSTLEAGPRTVTDLADALGLPISCISRHLRVLRETMLVNAHRLGSTILYSMSDQRIVQVIELLRLASAQPTRLVSRVAAQECENIPGANQ
jgi:DNA-binding transcriptional ArsR family regulator